MAIIEGRFADLLKPGLERACLESLWAEEIKAGNRKVIAEVLEIATQKLEAFDAHQTSS